MPAAPRWVVTRCPFCDAAPFPDREGARAHVLAVHPDRVEDRLQKIPERTRSHMVNAAGWAAGALLTEHGER
jgi:hypothetical protein